MVSQRCISCARFTLLSFFFTTATIIFLHNGQQVLHLQAEDLTARLKNLSRVQVQVQELQEKLKTEANETKFYLHAYGKQTEILEQAARKKNLFFHGIPSGGGKDEVEDVEKTIIDVIKKELAINLTRDDIDLSKRVTKPAERDDEEDGVDSAIFVRFAIPKQKSKIFFKRKSFPKSIWVEEDLTSLQQKNLKKLKKMASDAKLGGKKIRWAGNVLYIDNKKVKLVDI